jgi:hypothetical protein
VGISVPSTITTVSGLGWPAPVGKDQQRRDLLHYPVRGGLGDPEQQRELPEGQVGAVVHRGQQDPVGQRQAPASTSADLLTAPTGHDAHQLLKLPDRQTREHRHPLRPVGPDHLLHTLINDQEFPSLRDNL